MIDLLLLLLLFTILGFNIHFYVRFFMLGSPYEDFKSFHVNDMDNMISGKDGVEIEPGKVVLVPRRATIYNPNIDPMAEFSGKLDDWHGDKNE